MNNSRHTYAHKGDHADAHGKENSHGVYDADGIIMSASKGIDLGVKKRKIVSIRGPRKRKQTTSLNCLSTLSDIITTNIEIKGTPLQIISDRAFKHNS